MMVERLSKPSEIIFIRHGHSQYTGKFPDLTNLGQKQIRKTAKLLEEEVKSFDRVIVYHSDSRRTEGSASLFLSTVGLSGLKKRTSKALRSLRLKDAANFNEKEFFNSTKIYAEKWFNEDPSVDEMLKESRIKINKRAEKFLSNYSLVIRNLSNMTGKSICCLAFTHFEVMVNYLQGIYPCNEKFPIKTQPIPQYAEAVIVKLDDPTLKTYTVCTRGCSVIARINPLNHCLEAIIQGPREIVDFTQKQREQEIEKIFSPLRAS